MADPMTEKGAPAGTGAEIIKKRGRVTRQGGNNGGIEVDQMGMVAVTVILHPMRVVTNGTWSALINHVPAVSADAVKTLVVEQFGAVVTAVTKGVSGLTFRLSVKGVIALSENRTVN